MKKHFVFLSVIAIMAILICSCVDPVTPVNYDVSGSGSVEEFKPNTIIKNKVVNLNESTDVYYEYFEFTAADGGNYSIYKDVDGTLAAQTSVNVEGITYDVPKTFSYEAKTGKITSTVNGNEIHSYLFKAGDTFAVASELLTTSAEVKSTLFNKWIYDDISFEFANDGNAIFLYGYESYKKSYSNNGGWINFGNTVPLYFGYFGSDYFVYYLAYKTTRNEVEAVGKALVVKDCLDFSGRQFILLK